MAAQQAQLQTVLMVCEGVGVGTGVSPCVCECVCACESMSTSACVCVLTRYCLSGYLQEEVGMHILLLICTH